MKFKTFMRRYRIWQFLIYAMILAIIFPFLCDWIFYGIWEYKGVVVSYDLIAFGVLAVFIFLWAYPFYQISRATTYHYKTGGRSYGYDRAHFNRTYSDLVEYFKPNVERQIKMEDLPIENWHDVRGLILGQKIINGKTHLLRIPQTTGNGTNLINLGLPGSGKTMAQIIPSAERARGSVLCWDLKGDILHWTKPVRERMGQKIKIFDPANPKQSAHYDPLAAIRHLPPDDRLVAIEQMMFILIPDTHGDGASKYFNDGARDVGIATIEYYLSQNATISLPEIVKSVLQSDVFTWILKIRDSGITTASNYTNSYVGSSERNISGIWSQYIRSLRPFALGSLATLLSDDGSDMISPADLDDGTVDLYLLLPVQTSNIYAPLMSLFVSQCMDHLLTRPDRGTTDQPPSPITFILDEVAATSIPSKKIGEFLSLSRSRNCSCFLTAQSRSVIQARFNEYADQILDLCQVISCFSAQAPESTEWLSKLFGYKKVLKRSNSETSAQYSSSSRSAQEALEPVLRPEDFQNLGGKVAIMYNGRYGIFDRTNAYD